MPQDKKEQMKRIARRVFYTVVIVGLAVGLLRWHKELYLLISSAEARQMYIKRLRDAGFSGILVFLALQIVQVVVAVIPGEPVEIMAGVLYGTIGGTVICLTGILLGSAIIYYFVKGIGKNPLQSEKHHKYRVLTDPKRAQMLLLLLFLVPGTPKDILIYFAPFLPVRPASFFAISTLARLPSVVSSTFAGANLAQGDFGVTLAVFVIAGAAGILGILYNQKLLDALERHKEKVAAKVQKKHDDKK